MADARISQLPLATSLNSADIIPFSSISGSQTRKITAANLALELTTLGLSVGTVTPTSAYNGQLWVNTSTNPPKLFVYNGETFVEISFHPADVGTSAGSIATNPGSEAPTNNATGQLWLDTSATPDALKVFDGSGFVRVDPSGMTEGAADTKYLSKTDASSTYLPKSGGTMTGNLILNGDPVDVNGAATKDYVDTEIAAIPDAGDTTPTGTVIYVAMSTAPTGYLKCDGSAVSRTVYSALHSAIGNTFGAGDNSTTFNLPDLRGEFIRCWNDGKAGEDFDANRPFGSKQSDTNKEHSHSITDPGHNHNVFNQISGAGSSVGGGGSNTINSTTGNRTTGISINNDGGHEARPRNVALLACIKT